LNPFQPAKVTLAKISLHSIQLDPNELNEYLKRTEEYLRIERQIRASREQLLNEVVVKAKRPDPIKDDSRRAMYGEPSNSVKFDVINTAGALSIFDVIQGRVPGVQITGSGMNRSIQIRGAANFSGVVEPLFLLDGMAVSKDAIMSIPPTDVEAVDILKGANAAIYGSQGGGGVVAILTKRGGSTYDWAKDQAEGVITQKILGYSPIRVFYAPKYDKEAPEHVQPDFRATLFWEPMIQTDKEGKAKVSFFASDAQTEVKVRLEGMNATGALGVKESTFKVN
jgi:TonB-dependent SusC/RagA subfamily outer membrane receptor